MNGSEDTPDYTNFRRSVAVENVQNDNYTVTQSDGATDSKRITVTVSSTANPEHFEPVELQTVVTKH
jgi:hypothetical protein